MHFNFFPHIQKSFWIGPFLPIFPTQICSRLLSLPCMPHSLPIIPLPSDTLQSHKHYKSSNSTLCLFFLPFPPSSVQTLFPSLCSQTEPAYKWQSSSFLCFSYHALPYILYFNQQNGLIKSNKTDHKPHFISHTNYYMFQHQGAIFTQFITNNGLYVQHTLWLPVALTIIIRIKNLKML